MVMPRKTQASSVGKIGKVRKASKAEQEEQLRLDNNQLHPPEWLTDEAKAEFMRVVDEAAKINTLDNLDLEVLAIYANACVVSRNAAKMIDTTGPVLSKEDKYGNVTYYTNPLVRVQDIAAKRVLACSSRLGLAATDRLKLIQPDKQAEEENKFVKFLKNG